MGVEIPQYLRGYPEFPNASEVKVSAFLTAESVCCNLVRTQVKSGYTVSVEGIQQGAQNTALGSTNDKDEGG